MKSSLFTALLTIIYISTHAQVTTINYSPSLSLPASSEYTNDHSSLTAAETVLCCCGPGYNLPSLHLSNYINSISYPFQSGYTYTIQLQGTASATGDLSAAQPVYFGVSLGSPSYTVNIAALAAAPTFPTYSSIDAYVNSVNGSLAAGQSVVDLSNNFLTGLLGVGEFATSTTTASTTIGPFTSTASQINIESFPVVGTKPSTVQENLSTCDNNPLNTMLENPTSWPFTNTSLSISGVIITAVPAITPAVHYVCGTQTYSVPGSTAATWTVSPATGVISLPPNNVGTSILATFTGQGNCTLTATLQPGNVTTSISISTQPTFTAVNATQSGSCDNGYQAWFLDAVPNSPVANNFAWTVSLNDGSYYFTSTNSPTTTINVEGRIGLGVTYDDACGHASQLGGATVYSNCNEPEAVQFDALPNPAGSTLAILPHRSQPGMKSNSKLPNGTTKALIAEVKIFDVQGRVRSDKHYGGVAQQQLDVSSLENGVYFILIYMPDGKIERKKIMVQH